MIRTNINKIKKGDIYCVLPEYEEHIKEAIDKGAKKVIVSHGNYNINTVKVRNTREYLNNYLKRYNNLFNNITIIGITGSIGKTTTSFLLYEVLNKLNIKCCYIGNLGLYKESKVKDINTLETDELYDILLDCYQNNYKYIIIEVNDTDLIRGLYDTIEFDIAVFTNLLNINTNYTSMDNYALTLQMLFSKLNHKGLGIINGDDFYKSYFITKKTLTYGFLDNDYQIDHYILDKNRTMFRYNCDNKYYHITTNLIGINNMYNLLAVIATLNYLRIPNNIISKVLNDIVIPYNMENIVYNNNHIILNRTKSLVEVKNIIKEVKYYKYDNIYVLIDNDDKDIINYLNSVTSYFIVISNSIFVKDKYMSMEDRNRALKTMLKLLKDNDVLLLLGECQDTPKDTIPIK